MKVQRTYLARVVQVWDTADVELPTSPDDDFGAFDEWVCNQGRLVSEHVETIDDDDLTIGLATS